MTTWHRRRGDDRFGRRAARPRKPWGRFQQPCPPALRPRAILAPDCLSQADWPELWAAATRQLRDVGLRDGTLRVYRQVLRSFRQFLRDRGAGIRPGCATPDLAREFLYRLATRHASWSWTATHITVLRTVFDKLGGAQITEGIPTPKRPKRLHDILEPEEVGRLLKVAGSTRDRLVILLLYGCGLRTSELCALRWNDVDMDARTLRVRFAGGMPCSDAQHLLQGERQVFLPANAVLLLRAESCYREGNDPVFGGTSRRSPAKPDSSRRSQTKPEGPFGQSISARTVERIVRRAATHAGLIKEVCCRTLRRSYAVQCLRDGMDALRLRDSLGHKYVESTLAYARYLRPKAATWADSGNPVLCSAQTTAFTFAPAVAAVQCSAP